MAGFSAETRLVPVSEPGGSEGAATEVTIELRQELSKGSAKIGGSVPKAGSFLVRRAAVATVREALDGLERISG